MIIIQSGFSGTGQPMTNPRIADRDIGGATITASSEVAGFEAVNANDFQTWTFWRPASAPATWQMDFAAREVSYVGIAAHDLATVGATVTIQKWDGSAWVNIMPSHVPADNGPILFLFTRITIDKLRVRITNAVGKIGIIMAGNPIELPRKARFTGSRPFQETVQDVYSDALSDGGHVLDRFLVRKASAVQMTVADVPESWAAGRAAEFRDMMAYPAFFADRPAVDANSIAFGLLAEPVQMTRERPVAGAARTLVFKVNGFAA